MTYCRKCGTQIDNDAQFCYKCGTQKNLTTTNTTTIIYCRKCGIQLDSNAKFCYKCGTPTFGPIPILTQTPATILSPITNPPPQQDTYEKLSNKTSHNETFPMIPIAALIITIIALIIAIVAFSPFMDIFNNHLFEQPGVNTVKMNIHLLRLLI